jgi:hypothetical protein
MGIGLTEKLMARTIRNVPYKLSISACFDKHFFQGDFIQGDFFWGTF